MPDPGERQVNLALFLAKNRGFVSAEQLRAEGLGYPEDQDSAAFLRMFERDKEALRAAGIAIEIDEDERYRIDRAGTFAGEVTLSAAETATIRTAVAALASDASFPFADDLAIALAKLGQGAPAPVPVATALADEDPGAQGSSAAIAAEAISARKLLSFDYTNAKGQSRPHEVAPYGIFFREGRWYLVGLEPRWAPSASTRSSVRTGIKMNSDAPKDTGFRAAGRVRRRRLLAAAVPVGDDNGRWRSCGSRQKTRGGRRGYRAATASSSPSLTAPRSGACRLAICAPSRRGASSTVPAYTRCRRRFLPRRRVGLTEVLARHDR